MTDNYRHGGPIVLLTDFGVSDPFAGQMKGVISGIAPGVRIIDLCHEVPPLNVTVAAMFLKGSWRYFPPGSIYVVVVDPGVGTERSAIIIGAQDRLFVGPDNGCLTPATEGSTGWEAVRIENPAYLLPEISLTFHGRDIFAPVAAHLANRVPLSEFGPRIESLVPIDTPAPELKGNVVQGEIVYIDHFGNAWTNISKHFLQEIGWLEHSPRMVFNVASCKVKGLKKTYLCDQPNKPIALINSFDLVEIAWPGDSAEKKMRLWQGVWVDLMLQK